MMKVGQGGEGEEAMGGGGGMEVKEGGDGEGLTLPTKSPSTSTSTTNSVNGTSEPPILSPDSAIVITPSTPSPPASTAASDESAEREKKGRENSLKSKSEDTTSSEEGYEEDDEGEMEEEELSEEEEEEEEVVLSASMQFPLGKSGVPPPPTTTTTTTPHPLEVEGGGGGLGVTVRIDSASLWKEAPCPTPSPAPTPTAPAPQTQNPSPNSTPDPAPKDPQPLAPEAQITPKTSPPLETPNPAPKSTMDAPNEPQAEAPKTPKSDPTPTSGTQSKSSAPPQESPSPAMEVNGGADGANGAGVFGGGVVHLPDTVTRLDTPQGAAVYLVGTAHFSRESQEDVANTIRAVKPDVVVVELCKARTAILQLDEETILQESRNLDFKKVQMIMRQHGKIQGVLYLLLLSVSAHITKQLGMAPGGEFRTAFAEARRSAPGCLIQLGDRPIQVTLSRALASLSLWHKVKLTWHILTSKEPISKEEVERCKQRDFILEMLAEMTGQFPAISEVFVKERDLYLCRSLQVAAHTPPGMAPRVVVGVVGIGHVPGIVERWGTVTDRDIAPIMRIPPPTLSSRILKTSAKLSFYGLICYGVYRWVLPRQAQAALASTLSAATASATASAQTALQSLVDRK
ncbi:traB domain-containing protein-like isoform X2 [Eriocheir sinensis]|uniref:traB domain-containing protein-like isoform X2 n=1 Tax=Eriocheir sinensis TaxID=95602 RepID=UPI0021C64B75|nr:traB domain-containing protein-like isoform X2 [Eriocheir sinensis]